MQSVIAGARTGTLRRANAADAPTIAALTDEAYGKYVPLLGRPPQPMTADYAQMAKEHAIWLLTLDGRDIGVLVLINETACALIYSVAVATAFQRQGWGKQLLAHAEREAVSAGYDCLRLYTNALMQDNVAFYKRAGYEESGREAYLGSILVHMRKPLARSSG